MNEADVVLITRRQGLGLFGRLALPVGLMAAVGIVTACVQIATTSVSERTFASVTERFDGVDRLQATLDAARMQQALVQAYISSADEDARKRFTAADLADGSLFTTAASPTRSPIATAYGVWRGEIDRDMRIMTSRPESARAFDGLVSIIQNARQAERARLEADIIAQSRISTWIRYIAAVFAALFICCALACLAFVSGGVIKPLQRLRLTMHELARGERTVVVADADRADEIGEMARVVKVFRDFLVERDALAKRTIADQIARDERQRFLEEAIVAFEDEVGRSLACVGERSSAMQEMAGSLAVVAGRAGHEASDMVRSSTEVTESISAVAAGAEELDASIQEISTLTSEAASSVTDTVALAQDTGETIDALNAATDKIGHVLKLIEAVAAQTSLLALNATIEAARAGDAGRGFAVVAAEVKNLAGQTSRATEEITEHVAEMRTTTSNTVEAIERIVSRTSGLHQLAGSIVNAMSQQSQATRDIAQSAALVSASTERLAHTAASMARVVQDTDTSAGGAQSAAIALTSEAARIKSAIEQFLQRVAA